MNNIFHYTVGAKILMIINSGYLDTTPKDPLPGERPLLWFSTNDAFERTAAKIYLDARGQRHLMTIDQMRQHLGGLYRFRLMDADRVVTWTEAKKRRLLPKDLAASLDMTARGIYKSNPSQWQVSVNRIYMQDLLLERLNDYGQWQSVGLEEAHLTLTPMRGIVHTTAVQLGA